MKTTRLLLAMMTAAGLTLAATAHAATTTKEQRDAAYKDAAAQYKSDKEACGTMSGNAKDVCMAEAKGKEKVAKAEADAAYKGTPKAREAARLAHADADHSVAKERCDDRSGNQKDVCVKEAKAAYVKAKADARVDRVAADARDTSAEKMAAARKEAIEDTRDAQYKVAVEKCDSLAGAAKDSCVGDAKTRYGKN